MEKNSRTLSIYSRTSAINLAVVHKYLQAQGFTVRTKSDLIDLALTVLRNTILRDNSNLSMTDSQALQYVEEHLDFDGKQVNHALKSLALTDVTSDTGADDLMEQFRKAQQLLAQSGQ